MNITELEHYQTKLSRLEELLRSEKDSLKHEIIFSRWARTVDLRRIVELLSDYPLACKQYDWYIDVSSHAVHPENAAVLINFINSSGPKALAAEKGTDITAFLKELLNKAYQAKK